MEFAEQRRDWLEEILELLHGILTLIDLFDLSGSVVSINAIECQAEDKGRLPSQ